MSTEMQLRDHLEAVAGDVALTPADVDVVTGRVRRGRWIRGLAVAAVLVAVVAVGVSIAGGRQELTAPPADGVSAGVLDWRLVSVAPDAGPIGQLISSRDGGFLLLTESQRWFRSQDGDSWTEHQPTGLGEGANITMIANTGNRLVAAGVAFDGSPLLATSLDGVLWEGALPGAPGVRAPVSIASVGDTVLVPYIDGSYESTVYRFGMASGWQPVDPPEDNVQVLAMSEVDGVFVAQVTDPAGGSPHRDYRSADGITWEPGLPIPMIQVNKPLTQPIVAGPDGWYLTSFSLDGEHRFLKSTDAENWRHVVDTVFEFGPPLLTGDESGILASLPISSDPGSGEMMQVLFSSDGETWEIQDLSAEHGVGSRWLAGALNENLVVVGGGGFEGAAPRNDGIETIVWVAAR